MVLGRTKKEFEESQAAASVFKESLYDATTRLGTQPADLESQNPQACDISNDSNSDQLSRVQRRGLQEVLEERRTNYGYV
eukprot:CAMPEP_0170504348 /NCGR_PEP_ID=MMETSP0208-20121228/47615_1 /TAXON_ID=197538 /ORGANISM="Strombidium inclinatum, Strain S3" /LENGTH=79 /DNA_ID=CAMNT_0010784549 /DNA_START=622 /DNA_END=861 /DNA_ORIENTATION=+